MQSGALGEGWSDAFATSVNNDPVYGEYNNGDYNDGIRGVAYDEDSLEYGDLCDDGPPTPCQVHNDGRIWAMAMWEERAALIAKHGFAAGKALHEQLLMTGIQNTPDTPSFHDARTGYLLADSLLDADPAWPTAGNQCLIWRVFADNELGVTAGPDADNDQTPTVSTATPAACDPQAVIAPPAVTPEGSAVALDGTGSVVGGDAGDTLSYAWDLDDDGQYDDSTSATPSVTFGDNGSYTVSLQVTNTAGYVDTVDATVTVTNVDPTVTIDASQVTSIAEGDSVSVLANFTDPGWLDTYPASSVDPGTSFLSAQPGIVTITDEGPPANVGTVQATLTYGDNGLFTVEVSLTDDDGGSDTDSFALTVTNVDPTATIDETGAVNVNGTPTIFADAGEIVPLSARVQDPGSDDETTSWDWGDGTSSTPLTSFVGAGADPLPSPDVNPRDYTTSDSHAWAEACMYDVTFSVLDDDAGSTTDTIKVLITSPPSKSRGAGYWQHQYKGNGNIDFTAARLDCYLAIVAFVSDVFNEVRDASTRPLAHDVIWLGGNGGDERQKLDRVLLVAWLNFANGGIEYDQPLDTTGDGVPDTTFAALMESAEAVRINPASTPAQLRPRGRWCRRSTRRTTPRRRFQALHAGPPAARSGGPALLSVGAPGARPSRRRSGAPCPAAPRARARRRGRPAPRPGAWRGAAFRSGSGGRAARRRGTRRPRRSRRSRARPCRRRPRRCSGRKPTVWPGASTPTSSAGTMFIAGEPMKPATKTFRGFV